MGTLGALAAVRLKGLVAFLVVVSAGVLVAAVAIPGGAALPGAIYYLVHSTLAAALLFLLTEPIARERGAAGDRLHSGAPVRRWTFLGLVFVFAAMAIAGLPPLSGFVGKLGILAPTAVLPQAVALWSAVLAAGLLATVALARAGSRVFWKSRSRPEGEAGLVPAGAAPAESVAIVGVVAVLLLLAVFAAPAQRYAVAAAAQLRTPAGYVTAVLLAKPVAPPAAAQREPTR